jgi:hypothetical protein
MHFNFALQYDTNSQVQENHVGVKLNETHHLLSYTYDMNILQDPLIDGSKDDDIKVNAEETNI